MKTKTPYIFILSLLLLIGAGVGVWYLDKQFGYKIEVVRAFYKKEMQNKNFEFGDKTKKELEKIILQEEIIKKSFIESEKIIDFITRIEAEAMTQDVKLLVEKVSYGELEVVAEKYSLKPVIFNLEIKGSRVQIESFLSKIKSSEKKLLTKELKLYKSSDAISEYTARVTIQGMTLSYE